MNSEIFGRLPPTRLFFRCAVPSMITSVFGALYQVADGLFVGRFIGEDALAAVNLIMPVIMIVFAFSNMIATGASVRASVLLGEGKREEAARTFTCSLKLIFLLSVVIGAVGLLLTEPIVRLLAPGATEEAIGFGIVYIKIYALFSPLLPIYFATDNFLRVCGRERLSMWIGIGTQLANIILDVILIALLGAGIWAAALTSCISMALGSVLTLAAFRGRRLDLYYTGGKIPTAEISRIFANGGSELFSNISTSVMSIAYNYFLLAYGGTTGVAAFSVIMYVDSVVGMLGFGICDALAPAISYCYGARLHARVRAIFKRVVAGTALTSLMALCFMLFIGEYAAPIFVRPEDTELLAVSIAGMKLFSLSYLTGWVDTCFSSYFTALERPARSLTVSLFGTIVFPISSLFILSPVWGLCGVWLAPLLSSAASAVLTVILAATVKSNTRPQPS